MSKFSWNIKVSLAVVSCCLLPVVQSDCPAKCSSHESFDSYGVCTDYVSQYGYCGTSDAHKNGGTNCTCCNQGSDCIAIQTSGGSSESPEELIVPFSDDHWTNNWPTPQPTTRPVCAVTVNKSVGEQETYDCPISTTPMVLYAGGEDDYPEFKWNLERNKHVDIMMIAFVNYWEDPCADAPADLGSIGVPLLWTNGCVNGTHGPAKCADIHVGNPCLGDDDSHINEMLDAQQNGQRIIISVGGQNANANNMDKQKGRDLAHAMWEMFLGGNDPAWTDMRPLGPKVVLDGIDLDLEQNPEDCVDYASNFRNIGPNCKVVMEGWAEFVLAMREYMEADTRKRYLITAVPINSKQTISHAGWGSHIQGYVDVQTCDPVWLGNDEDAKQVILDTMSNGYLKHADKLDFIWPQFYPSPTTITMNGDCWEADLAMWSYICKNGGENSKCRAGVGLPMGSHAAAGGIIDPWTYIAKIKEAVKKYPILRERFGGSMGWNQNWDWVNYGAKGEAWSKVAVNLMQGEVQPLLTDDAFQPTKAPTASPDATLAPSFAPTYEPEVCCPEECKIEGCAPQAININGVCCPNSAPCLSQSGHCMNPETHSCGAELGDTDCSACTDSTIPKCGEPTPTTRAPSTAPTRSPTKAPTKAPTLEEPAPTKAPTKAPTFDEPAPTKAPTKAPTFDEPTPEPNECNDLTTKKKCKKNENCKYVRPAKKCFSLSELEEIDCSAFQSKSECKMGACKWRKKKNKCINY